MAQTRPSIHALQKSQSYSKKLGAKVPEGVAGHIWVVSVCYGGANFRVRRIFFQFTEVIAIEVWVFELSAGNLCDYLV
jgi:hypothetical protein